MTIKITIKKDSKAAVAFKKYMADKEAFRKAIRSGNAIPNTKQRPVKLATPV